MNTPNRVLPKPKQYWERFLLSVFYSKECKRTWNCLLIFLCSSVQKPDRKLKVNLHSFKSSLIGSIYERNNGQLTWKSFNDSVSPFMWVAKLAIFNIYEIDFFVEFQWFQRLVNGHSYESNFALMNSNQNSEIK